MRDPAPSKDYAETVFSGLDCAETSLAKATFERCTFLRCHFSTCLWAHARFEQCLFQDCSLLNLKLQEARFREVRFERCKLAGLNWAQTYKALGFSISLNQCKLISCVFQHMDMHGLSFASNELEECLFENVILRKADFSDVPLAGTRFHRCNLQEAQFVNAVGFLLDPRENDLEKACFSLDGALELLRVFRIQLYS